ncbi:MAG TPA: bacillithiol biosynthesis deacetylase BshB1 [Gemmatimonadales bacterium]|jgi:bacillithiol biosynthesis deacetylase BshB1|nr:bacillithiol biosynthesis deacetylase BshB1 [Gemmatimonadales bacterium]
MNSVDVLAVMAHPDDAELLCGGTLARAHDQGNRTGILDLSRGELGSRGTPELRAQEAAAAAAVLGVAERTNAGLPDGHFANTDATRAIVVEHLRRFRPRVVLLPFPVGRHPDHRVASELVRDACFLSGLKNYPAAGEPFRPFKLCHAMAYREDTVKPTFVVDISAQFERKLAAVACYASQFSGLTQAGELYGTGQPLSELITTQNAHYGSLIRARYGEPFWTAETMVVDDVMGLGVQTL